MKTNDIIESRQDSHGDYATKAEFIQQLKCMMAGSFSWHLMTPSEQESLDNIAQKIGRICFGNPHFKDHWDDIAGYAVLVADQSEEVESTDEPEDGLFDAMWDMFGIDLFGKGGFKDGGYVPKVYDPHYEHPLRDGERKLSEEEMREHFYNNMTEERKDEAKKTSEESREEVEESFEEALYRALFGRTEIGKNPIILVISEKDGLPKSSDNKSEECHH